MSDNSPEQFEAYRNKLHREIALKWPLLNHIPDTKSTAYSNTRLRNKSTLTFVDNDMSYSKLSNVTSVNQIRNNPLVLNDSEFSLDQRQQNIEWNSKAQEGIVTYELPDGLPDGVALHNKLQTLMKTNTIYLNDRQFWNTLEHRFKTLRKKSVQENMERLRQNQQKYEQELIAKGILPYTTEEAIRRYGEEQRSKKKIDKIDLDFPGKCTIDYNPSDEFPNKNEELEAFESDNIHPRLHEVFTDYKFQTKLGKEIGENLQDDLLKSQAKLKTIFPKTNQQDLIRQELEVVKTSEGLYAYSNRLAKQLSK